MNPTFTRSNVKSKKYLVTFYFNGRKHKVNFGQLGYQHYKDKTPIKLYSNLDHNDRDRRRRYLARATMIRDKKGNLTKDNPLSPNYWAIRYLW